ncbi:MAG: type II toxin-antitoxin system VapB family antitoxin [Deltaproteobacteria bacterium]|nr:type II toxin-antitoxin system VapB family antitoxin [Deltaproteobacteria bacterium]
MAIRIDNPEVEQLAAELAELLSETETEAIRKALLERRQRIALTRDLRDRRTGLVAFLEQEIWPEVPRSELGRRLSREEEDAILGYGPEA